MRPEPAKGVVGHLGPLLKMQKMITDIWVTPMPYRLLAFLRA
jgi:hypothetical protein